MKIEMRVPKFMCIFLLGLLVEGCGDGANKTSAVRILISEQIHQELDTGASRYDIEKFFEKHGMTYTYDKSNKRYQSLIRTGNSESVLTLIYLSNDQKFEKAEVQEILTGP